MESDITPQERKMMIEFIEIIRLIIVMMKNVNFLMGMSPKNNFLLVILKNFLNRILNLNNTASVYSFINGVY